MELFIFICVIISNSLPSYGETIGELIASREELSSFYRAVRHTDFFQELSTAGNKRYTLFAPTNDALQPNRLPSSVVSDINSATTSSSKRRLNSRLQYHTAYGVQHSGGTNVVYVTYSISELQNKAANTALGSNKKLFFRTIGSGTYVNGAKLLVQKSNLQAENGIVHMIDSFLHQLPSGETALDYIRNDGARETTDVTFTEFEKILIKYDEDRSRNEFSALEAMNILPKITVFAPSDAGLNRMNRNRLNQIKNNAALLKTIVESHIIVDDAYHGNILRNLAQEDQTIPAMYEHIVPKYFSNHLEVSNQCAKGRVTHGNFTVYNGVVHIIDGLLGYVYNDVIESLDEHGSRTLASFMRSVDELEDMVDLALGETDPDESDMVTVFAPPDQSFIDADVTNGRVDNYDRIARMHMIQGRFDTSEMENQVTKDTLRPGYKAKFYRIEDESGVINTYVEVNNVRTRILVGDICVRNGIVHRVDHIMGVPTKSIYEYIDETLGILLSTRRLISSSGHDQQLGDNSRRQTFFAPSNSAIDIMSEDSTGAQILDRKNPWALRNLLDRHTVGREVIMAEQSSREKSYQTEFRNEEITIIRGNNGNYTVRYKGVVAPVLRHDMRMTNGILHIIDGVLFGNTELSRASLGSVSLALLTVSYSLCRISVHFLAL